MKDDKVINLKQQWDPSQKNQKWYRRNNSSYGRYETCQFLELFDSDFLFFHVCSSKSMIIFVRYSLDSSIRLHNEVNNSKTKTQLTPSMFEKSVTAEFIEFDTMNITVPDDALFYMQITPGNVTQSSSCNWITEFPLQTNLSQCATSHGEV